MVKQSKKTRVVTFRLEHDVYNKFKRQHPHVCAYLRNKITRDIVRSDKRKG